MKAPPSPDEPRRLQALQRYQVLDTASEELFDGITRLISHICGTPMAVISLVDEDRQWFKSEFGLNIRQTPLELSVCAHAILEPGIFIVPDTKSDARFADNPLVLAENGLRFYASAPLQTEDGFALGTLCVLDRVPRDLTPAQRDALETLAKTVMSLIELRRSHYEQLKIAHDLTNLASGIQGITGILLEDTSLGPSLRDDLHATFRAAERSALLCQQLRLSKPLSSAREPIEINRLVTDSVQMVSRFLRTELRVNVELSPLNPIVEISATRFEQILLNLLMNARDAIPKSGRISVGTAVSLDSAVLTVRDTGQGIPAELVPRIFDRFYTTKKWGTGLGLASVREIVENAGGQIEVESTIGTGTLFTIRLPLITSLAVASR